MIEEALDEAIVLGIVLSSGILEKDDVDRLQVGHKVGQTNVVISLGVPIGSRDD